MIIIKTAIIVGLHLKQNYPYDLTCESTQKLEIHVLMKHTYFYLAERIFHCGICVNKYST